MIRVYPDDAALAQASAEHFVENAKKAVAERGIFSVALSGGHTPAAAFRLLAAEPLASEVPWERVHVFWGDERTVPNSDPNSNEKMAREALLNAVPIPPQNIHPMYNGGTNVEAAADYDSLLHSFFLSTDRLFDMVMMGMGPDGHTLSLFPGAANIDATSLVIPTSTDVWPVHDRISLSAKAVAMSREVVVAAAGADKAVMVKAIIDDNADYPLSQVLRKCSNVVWMLDEAAASGLKHKSSH